jgi:TatD DNase family protein
VRLIDTHCHLDAKEFERDRSAVIQQSVAAGVEMMVVPAVAPENFKQVAVLAEENKHCSYALGIHPMFIDKVKPDDIASLDALVSETLQYENKLVAIGEIGLDFYVTRENKATQEFYFREQLCIAKKYNLPVILHVRSAIDDVLKYLRRANVSSGIAHAFNGSMHQAEAFIALGFKLGFGGAMTHTRAKKIRALAQNLPLESIVLETDAPDIAPAWLDKNEKNSPKELMKIATVLADIRGISVSQIIEITRKNSIQVLPKLADLFT